MVCPIATAILICCTVAPGWPQETAAYQEALADVQKERLDLAIPLLENVVASAPRDLKARNLLGTAVMKAGRKEHAATQFQKALEMEPAFATTLKNLRTIADGLKNFVLAVGAGSTVPVGIE